MAGVDFITHKGVKILYENFSQIESDEVLALIEKAKAIIHVQPLNSVLALANIKDTHFNMTITSALKDFTKSNIPYVKCAAVYGVEGLKEVIYKGILAFTGRKNIVLFRNLEEAKDYLANLK